LRDGRVVSDSETPQPQPDGEKRRETIEVASS
jgi:hypothetical protein